MSGKNSNSNTNNISQPASSKAQPSYAGQQPSHSGQHQDLGAEVSPSGVQQPNYAGQQTSLNGQQGFGGQPPPNGGQQPSYAGQQQNLNGQQSYEGQPPPHGGQQPNYAGQQPSLNGQRGYGGQPPPDGGQQPFDAGQQQSIAGQPAHQPAMNGDQQPIYAGQQSNNAPAPAFYGGQPAYYTGQQQNTVGQINDGQAPQYQPKAGYVPQGQQLRAADPSTDEPWKPVGKATKFYDYTLLSWPWISTPAAFITWGLFAYCLFDFFSSSFRTGNSFFPGLDDLAILAVPFVVAAVLSFIAYIGWFPNDRLEIDVKGRRLYRIPPPIQYEERSFKLDFAEISAVQLRQREVVLVARRRDGAGRAHRKLKRATIHELVALPTGQSIYTSRRFGGCRRMATKVSQLLGVPLH